MQMPTDMFSRYRKERCFQLHGKHF